MNENLNLVEILKDCPIGTKLYYSAHGEVELEEVHLNSRTDYPIEVRLSNNVLEGFTQDGRLFEKYNGECMLFPSREQRRYEIAKDILSTMFFQPENHSLTVEADVDFAVEVADILIEKLKKGE